VFTAIAVEFVAVLAVLVAIAVEFVAVLAVFTAIAVEFVAVLAVLASIRAASGPVACACNAVPAPIKRTLRDRALTPIPQVAPRLEMETLDSNCPSVEERDAT
jgi:hypothetical protein